MHEATNRPGAPANSSLHAVRLNEDIKCRKQLLIRFRTNIRKNPSSCNRFLFFGHNGEKDRF